ncbi:MAG: hypothetical protein BMS9Abin34_423 [Patescibacteria group bacterium]|nr:MAG: hypothetical protein BMS9Abin34_423 [Patescibacteria group bacterium]
MIGKRPESFSFSPGEDNCFHNTFYLIKILTAVRQVRVLFFSYEQTVVRS